MKKRKHAIAWIDIGQGICVPSSPGFCVKEVMKLVRREWEIKEWRPTVVAAVSVVIDGKRCVCVLDSLKQDKGRECEYTPDLPKGGIEPGEDLCTALWREMEEEISLPEYWCSKPEPLTLIRVPFSSRSKGRDKYQNGKLWFCFQLRVPFAHIVERIKPGTCPKVKGIRWLSPNEAIALWGESAAQIKIAHLMGLVT